MVGVETARALALHGAHLVMTNRSVEASEALRERLRAEGGERCGPIDVIPLDLSSLASVREAAREFQRKGWSVISNSFK
jgi:NAD(P)-dependent dehydrogenase (short-subunit alcohol dehydrogenase family)